MSGHSKWSTIKHQKAATDQARGQVFTKLGNAITIAVHEGGGVDPDSNFKLRLAIEKARQANMPKNNIERAISKGSGKGLEGTQLAEVLYEGFASGGVAVLALGVTDNKQRTGAEVRNTFQIHGGTLGSTGSVAYLFTKMGEIRLDKKGTQDELLEIILGAGVEDIIEETASFIVYTKPQEVHTITQLLINKGYTIHEKSLLFKPQMPIAISDDAKLKLNELREALELLGDIHKVYTNLAL